MNFPSVSLPSCDAIGRMFTGLCAAVIGAFCVYYAIAVIVWLLPFIIALLAAAGFYALAANRGYDMLVSGCATLFNKVRG